MSDAGKTQFLDRKSYRTKRVIDASKLLPSLGILGFLIPPVYLFVTPDARSPGLTAIYLFLVWLILIVCAAFLAPRMQDPPKSD